MSAKPEQQFLPNLLRERRQELGLPAELPPWRSSRFCCCVARWWARQDC